MDQGVCEQLKYAISDREDVVRFIWYSHGDAWKSLMIKDCIYLIAELGMIWDEAPQSTLFKAQNKIYSDRPSSYGSSSPTENLQKLQAVVAECKISDANDPGYELANN